MSETTSPYARALALFAAGRSREAVQPLRDAVFADPALAAAWRLLGHIQFAAGDVSAAVASHDAALAADPRYAGLGAAIGDLMDGRLEAAEESLRATLARQPSALAAAHLLAEVWARQGRPVEAERLLAECVRQAPGLGPARESLALVRLRLGQPGAALGDLDPLLTADPQNHRARMAKAAALSELGEHAAAAEVTAAIAEAFPDQPCVWLTRGAGLRTLGRIEAAIAAFRRALDLDPACGEAWWALANLKTYRFPEGARGEIEAQLDRADLPPAERANLAFTLGKLEEDAGEDAAAFAAYARGAGIEKARRTYQAGETTALVQRAQATFTPRFFAGRAGWGDPAADPIFIIGMPRSGSTLVDQILCSHPEVEGLQELHDIRAMADWLGGQGGADPAGLASLPREAAAQLGADYLARTRAKRREGRARFTDKAPWNWMHVGLIATILPNARIVDVRRHPMACGFSIFTQHFSQGWDFAYDLADIGRYYADYVALMAHFDSALPGRVHRVIYERLVADLEGETRRLLAALDLPFDPACLRFFETERAVATPSSEQVRQPIFTDALDHWRRFERWLDPLNAALGPALDAYPDAPSA